MNTSIKTQISRSKVIITVLAFAIISMFSIGCSQQQITCDNTNTLFHQIYTNVATAAGNTDRDFMDNSVHQYSFTVSANEIICGVGYRAYVALPYKIEIIDNTTAATLYSNTSTFTTGTPSYVSVPNISVVPGHSYTVRRTLVGAGGLNTQGRIAMATTPSTPVAFPATVGALTITGCDFYDSGTGSSSPVNVGIPFIDIVFQ